jgi:hypothetical protein
MKAYSLGHFLIVPNYDDILVIVYSFFAEMVFTIITLPELSSKRFLCSKQ